MSNRIAESTDGEIKATYERMVEICALLQPTQSPDAMVEYSAMMCAAALVMAIDKGVEPIPENCRAILEIIVDQVAPAIERQVRLMT